MTVKIVVPPYFDGQGGEKCLLTLVVSVMVPNIGGRWEKEPLY